MVKSGESRVSKIDSPSTPRTRAKETANGTTLPSPASATTPRSTRKRKEIKYADADSATEDIERIETQKSSAQKRKVPQFEEAGFEPQRPVISKRNKAVKGERESLSGTAVSEVNVDSEVEYLQSPSGKTKKSKSAKVENKKDSVDEKDPKPKRARKTKEEKDAEAMPLAMRTHGLRMYFGAHVSCAKGVQNGVLNSVHIGGNAFAMFLKSQRKWDNPPLLDEHRDQFKAFCAEYGYDAASHILPHGSYLVNLANPDPEPAAKAFSGFIDDLHRCEALGIKFYNFHPGTTGSHPRSEAIGRIATALNRAIKATHTVVPLLENMATAGSNVVGSAFEDLRDIISQVDDKSRIGVCLDTCHAFAAGYDLRSPEAFKETLDKFDNIVGMNYLKALHLNDSKAPLAAGRDLHQNIGLGFLGLKAFHNVANEKRFEGLPLILETPIDSKDDNGKEVENKSIWANEIKMLEEMIGLDVESERFKRLEKELADKGADERAKYQDAFQRKKAKLEKGQSKLSFGKAKRKEKNDETESEK